MEQTVRLDNHSKNGFTLIEVLISILLLLIISLALLQAMGYFVIKSTENNLRNEAIKIAQECAEKIRHLDQCIPGATGNPVNGTITRKIGNANYSFTVIYTNPNSFNSGNNHVSIIVKYNYRGKEHNYNIVTTVYKE